MVKKKLSDTDFPIAEDRQDSGGRISLVVILGIAVFLCLCVIPAAGLIMLT